MTSISLRAAEALSPALDVFHAMAGCALKDVRQISVDGSLEGLIFDFGSVLLTVIANENDDTVELAIVPDARTMQKRTGEDVSHLEPWTEFINCSFGWGWVTVNQQGYVDGVLLSFDGLIPQILLNVVASSVKVSKIVAISAR